MSSDTRSSDKQGPQGTQMFSAAELEDLLAAEQPQAPPADKVQLIGMAEPVADKVFPLHAGQMTIGRAASCDIRIDEPSLSAEHARLNYTDKGWRIINLLSTNGIYVNEQKVFAHDLQHGDVLRLGRIRLRFDYPDDKRARAAAINSGARKWWQILLLLSTLIAAGVWAYLR